MVQMELVQEMLEESGEAVRGPSAMGWAASRPVWGRAAGRLDNVSTLPAPVSHAPSRVQMTFREPLALVKSFLFDR